MIEREQAIVYLAPTKGRRYFSKSAAINAEARAIIKKYHPDERSCSCSPDWCGMCGYGGWSLEADEPDRFNRYFEKLKRALRNRLND